VKSNTNDLNLPAVYEDSSPYWTPERLAQIEAQRHLEPKLARLLSDPTTEGTRDSVLAFMTGLPPERVRVLRAKWWRQGFISDDAL